MNKQLLHTDLINTQNTFIRGQTNVDCELSAVGLRGAEKNTQTTAPEISLAFLKEELKDKG